MPRLDLSFLPKKTRLTMQVVMGAVAVAIGLLFFVRAPLDDVPVAREQAVAVSGVYDRGRESKNYVDIVLKDDTTLSLYSSATSSQVLEELTEGMELQALLHPDSGYVVELRVGDRELLPFQATQEEIYRFEKDYVYLGWGICVLGLALPGLTAAELLFVQRERRRKEKDCHFTPTLVEDPAAGRVLLQTQRWGHDILYRRYRLRNQLIVDGWLYDEIKVLLEFPHTLRASVDGHLFEAGLDEEEHSFISVDGHLAKRKQRIV